MSARFEAFLARLYVDADARAHFLADPTAAAIQAHLDPAEVAAVGKIDRLGLQMAATSFARKRRAKGGAK
jgi:hypothetical protein